MNWLWGIVFICCIEWIFKFQDREKELWYAWIKWYMARKDDHISSSVYLSCPTLWDAMECGTSCFPVLHYLPGFAPIHVHWVGDAIQPSYPLPSPHALNLSQHQNLFQWVGFSHQLAKVLELQFQLSSLPMNIQGWFPLELTGLILLPKGLSGVISSTTVQKHQFFSAQPSLWFNSHIDTWLLGNP